MHKSRVGAIQASVACVHRHRAYSLSKMRLALLVACLAVAAFAHGKIVKPEWVAFRKTDANKDGKVDLKEALAQKFNQPYVVKN